MSGLTKVRREHALASSTSDSAQAMALSGRIGSPGRGKGGLCLQPLVVLGLAPGAVGHLPLELAAGGVAVVAARAPHRREHAGAVEQLLQAAAGSLVRTLETRAQIGRASRRQRVCTYVTIPVVALSFNKQSFVSLTRCRNNRT